MLRRLAAAALRSGGRTIVAHVVPDSITPWDIRKTASRASSSAWNSLAKRRKKKKAKKDKEKKASTGTTRKPGNASKGSSRSSGTTRPKFDKNSWSQGRNLQSAVKWHDDEPASATSPKSSSRRSFGSTRQQVKDFAKHPGLVIQMKADELFHTLKRLAPRR